MSDDSSRRRARRAARSHRRRRGRPRPGSGGVARGLRPRCVARGADPRNERRLLRARKVEAQEYLGRHVAELPRVLRSSRSSSRTCSRVRATRRARAAALAPSAHAAEYRRRWEAIVERWNEAVEGLVTLPRLCEQCGVPVRRRGANPATGDLSSTARTGATAQPRSAKRSASASGTGQHPTGWALTGRSAARRVSVMPRREPHAMTRRERHLMSLAYLAGHGSRLALARAAGLNRDTLASALTGETRARARRARQARRSARR